MIRKDQDGLCKIICSNTLASIKIEPNYVIRGCIAPPRIMQNSSKVQEMYGFASMKVLSFGELYGGKVCAALDRQHPRDLFDIRYLLNTEGITPEIKFGFMVSLLSHNRPPHEILKPHIQNQEAIFAKEFSGMTEEKFSYDDHKNIMNQLIEEINTSFSDNDKSFLVGFFSATPDWKLVDIDRLSELSAVKWKMLNLESLRKNNNEKFLLQIAELRKRFEDMEKSPNLALE